MFQNAHVKNVLDVGVKPTSIMYKKLEITKLYFIVKGLYIQF